MKKLFLVLFLLCGAAFAQLPTPTFTFGSGTYPNSVTEIPQNTTAGVTYVASLNGTTPTATVAGTCDAGFYCSTGGAIQITSSGTLKVIATKVGSTNSAVASATYTITTQAPTNPVSVPTPTKITNSTGSTVASQPSSARDSSGNILIFYSECGCGVATDNGGTARVMAKYSSNGGASWTPIPNVSCAFAGDPASGCFYDESTGTTANIADGITVVPDYNGYLILLIAQWGGTGTTTPEGVIMMRCAANCIVAANWSSPVFLTTPTYTAANDFINPTANIVSIPPSSPGVTGTCASGCDLVSVFGENAFSGHVGLIITTNSGTSWADPLTINQTWPFSAGDERAILWAGGMNLMYFQRPSGDTAQLTEQSSPTPPEVLISTNMGASYNSFSYDGGTQFGTPSNLPNSACGVTPGTSWRDTFTRPSIAIDPNNSALATLLYGERLSCNGVSTFDWKIVTFNIASALSGNAQNLPLPQTLQLGCYTSTTQAHTTYSFGIPLNATQLLMVFEQGCVSSTALDIYAVTMNYPVGQTVSGNVSFSGGVSIQ
jgi:hypothetical protein